MIYRKVFAMLGFRVILLPSLILFCISQIFHSKHMLFSNQEVILQNMQRSMVSTLDMV